MRGWETAALWPDLPFVAWAGGESRRDSSHAVHTLDVQVREHAPPEGF